MSCKSVPGKKENKNHGSQSAGAVGNPKVLLGNQQGEIRRDEVV